MRTFMRATLSGLLSLAFGTVLHAQAPGPVTPDSGWQVGFAMLNLLDSARTLPSGELRPLDIGVWYPARSTSRTTMTYRDFYLVSAGARDLGGFVQFMVSKGAKETDLNTWLDAPMRSIRDATPVAGQFPLILLAQGNGQTIHDQAPLAEYLASRGYVVGTTPSPMRITGPLTDEAQVGARAAEQARDLQAAADMLGKRDDVAPGPPGIVAHSFGARAGLLLMMGSRVAALVSLDGGIGTATARGSMESAPGYRVEAATAPILHFYEELDSYMAPEFSMLKSLERSARWIQQVPLRHHLFTSLGAAGAGHPSLRAAMGATDTSGAAYEAVVRQTLIFLDAFLKGSHSARSQLHTPAAMPPLGPLEKI